MASLVILEKRKEKVEVPRNMVSSFTPYSTSAPTALPVCNYCVLHFYWYSIGGGIYIDTLCQT